MMTQIIQASALIILFCTLAFLVRRPVLTSLVVLFLRKSVVILLLNTAVSFLAGLSFMLFIFKRDLILAAVPAVFALPGIILQPWFLICLFLPGGFFVAPFVTSLVTVPVYIWLERTGRLEGIKSIIKKIKCRRGIFMISGVVLLGLSIMYCRYIDFPSVKHGIPERMHFDLKEYDIRVENSRYYCLYDFIDSAYLWQARIAGGDLERLIQTFHLEETGLQKVPAGFLKMSPYWWRPIINDKVKVYSTKYFPAEGRGMDGDYVFASWNPETQMLHMWVKYNF